MKTITSIISIFVVIVGFSKALDTCTKPCFKIYLPVCGYNKHENLFKSFSNECYLNNEHCKDNQNWVKVDDAYCKATLVEVDDSENVSEVKELSAQCFTRCTREYMPVCASNGEQYKVFSNKCVMQNEHCKDHKDWVKVDDAYCKATLVEVEDSGNISEVRVPCVKPCTREYMPVCASNGEQYKVFSNKCVMRNEHCKDHKEWAIVKMSMCLHE